VVAALIASAPALAIPSVALANPSAGGSGGTALAPGAGESSSSKTQTPTPRALLQPGNNTVTAAGDGIAITSRAAGFLRGIVRFSGNVASRHAGDVVEIERLGHQTDWQWTPTVHGTVASDGSFAVTWRANHIGQFAFRAVLEKAVAAPAIASSPPITVTVYRYALATQEGGPTVYGHRTACGQTFRPSTIGTANRTLRCGEKVALYYHGRTLVVPVIDRGPYAHGADFDISFAAAKKLGLGGISRIGAVSLPRAPSRVAASLR
jgi:rare lipoprotein A